MTHYLTKTDLLKKGRDAIGKSFGEIDRFNRLSTAKGSLGHVIEESHFGYKINSNKEADFTDAGVELKVTPYIRKNNRYIAKERLVLNIINYMEEYKRTFENSSFWVNNNSLLIMFYEHIVGINKKDFKVNECILYEYPEEDLLIIQSDWKKIITKIREGKAHEISEADTNFLGACTKGRTAATSFRQQPFSNEKAKQRAYCLKQPYMSYMIENYVFGMKKDERIIKSPKLLKNISFEEFVVSQLKPYFGRSQSSLLSEFGFTTRPKNINELIIAKILGVKGRLSQTEEFKKANIVPKTIRMNRMFVVN